MGILDRFKKDDDDSQKTSSTVAASNAKSKAAESKKDKPKEKASKATKLSTGVSDVIVKPLITEKSATLASAGQYVFVVRKNANRIEVRSAIKSMYGITPVSVNISNVRGKRVRFGRRRGKRKDWKKAIVTLPKGKTINVYEGV